MVAAGNYHSATPEYHNRYRDRLAKIWDRERKGLNRPVSMQTMQAYYEDGNKTSRRVSSNGLPEIDYARTEQLNEAFKNRQKLQASEIAAAQAGAGPISAQSLGDSWKSAYTTNADAGNYALKAQINRIRKAAAEQQALDDALRAEAETLAAKRKAELDLWRKMYNKALSGSSSSSTSLYGNL